MAFENALIRAARAWSVAAGLLLAGCLLAPKVVTPLPTITSDSQPPNADTGAILYANEYPGNILVPWLEMPDRYRYAVPLSDESVRQSTPTGLRVIKTHLEFDDLVYTPNARYIWIARDPKDVFVSSYHFMRSSMLGPLMPSVDRWLDLYLSPDTFMGSWAEHLRGGWENRRRPNVLFTTYEEMKADLPGVISRIARLMRIGLSRR
jgi:hypothetical protein